MKKIFLCLLTGLCLSGVSAQRDWAQFAKYEAANRRIDYPVKAVFMGNSITEGWARMRPGFFADNGYIGRGISGQTSAEMLARFRPDVIELDPDVWMRLATGITSWDEEKDAGRITAVGERDDLSGLLPLA